MLAGMAPALTAKRPYRCGADRLYRRRAPSAHCAASAATAPISGPPMNATPRQPASRLEQLLRSRQFVITAELAPPVSCDAEDLLRKARPLRGLADAVNVTDGASARATLSAPIAAALLAREGIEPVLQLTCRDRNRIALQADLMGAAACGVHNLLCLTGDDPKAGDQPDTKAVFDVDSTTLTVTARDLRD
ncbi:MAG: methylenetetrahydrofolate reductase, partial [Xanthobacteraceae bacterium]